MEDRFTVATESKTLKVPPRTAGEGRGSLPAYPSDMRSGNSFLVFPVSIPCPAGAPGIETKMLNVCSSRSSSELSNFSPPPMGR